MNKKRLALIGSFVVFAGLVIGVVMPAAGKMKVKARLDEYFRLQGITAENFERINYFTENDLSFGRHSDGACVVYKNEPEYIYTYSYFGIEDGVYPNIMVAKNGRVLSLKECKELKNYTVSHYEFNKYFVF